MRLLDKGKYKSFVRDNNDDENVIDEVITRQIYTIEPEWFNGGIIIDIGANIGTFCIPNSKYAEVWAFEPNPSTYNVLEANVGLNKANVKIFNYGFGNSKFSKINNRGGSSSVIPELKDFFGEPTDREFDCDIKDISELQFGHCNLMKIDCEGSEYDILENMPNEMWIKIDRMIIEFHPFHNDKRQSYVNEILNHHYHQVKRIGNVWYFWN